MGSTYVYLGSEGTSGDSDGRESVTYECTMCSYRDDLEHDYETIWHPCANCGEDRLFEPVEKQPAVDKV